jgi:protein SCO1
MSGLVRAPAASGVDTAVGRGGDPSVIRPGPRSSRRGLVRTAALGGVAGLAAALVLSSLPKTVVAQLHGIASWAPGNRPAPEFQLRDQTGRPVSLGGASGHPVLLTFMDSHCTRACPVEGRMLRRAVQALPPAERPVLMVVSVNAADTPTSARHFAERSGFAGMASWHWLMGPPARLAPVWRAYGVGVKPTAGDIEHTTVVYLIDSRGDERAAYGVPFLPSMVASDVQALERESHPAWHWPWS